MTEEVVVTIRTGGKDLSSFKSRIAVVNFYIVNIFG